MKDMGALPIPKIDRGRAALTANHIVQALGLTDLLTASERRFTATTQLGGSSHHQGNDNQHSRQNTKTHHHQGEILNRGLVFNCSLLYV